MTFAAPLALWLLAPWAAAVVWALMGRGEITPVPFVRFWPTSAGTARQRRWRRPPWAIVGLLAAMLAAVFAAAGPVMGGGAGVTLLVDRGLPTMAALRAGGAAAVAAELARLGVDQCERIDLFTGERRAVASADLPAVLESLRPTAIDSAIRLQQGVRSVLATTQGPIVVVSVNDPRIANGRLLWLPPAAAVENAGIARFAITPGLHPQAMVTVWNATDQTTATLSVGPITREIELPPRGQSRDYFFSLPALGDAATATLHLADAIAADNTVYLARTADWPTVSAAGPLPEALRRLLSVYAEQRPSSGGGNAVTVTTDPAVTGRAVIVKVGGEVVDAVAVDPHAITRDVDVQTLFPARQAVGEPGGGPGDASPAEGWRSIVRAGGRTLVAVREKPERQVWVGAVGAMDSTKAAYVVFWTAVFDFLGNGPPAYAAEAAFDSPADWRRRTPALEIDAAPGLFDTPAGPRATNVFAVQAPAPTTRPAAHFELTRPAPLRRPLLLTAAALLVAVQALAGRDRPDRGSP